jgi:hypothetical protein
MKNKSLFLIIIVLLIILIILFSKSSEIAKAPAVEEPSATTSLSSVPTTPENGLKYKDLVKVSNLSAGALIKSPFTLKGEARGNWYFEATFPVKVTDQSGKVLFQGPAHAEADWMTTEYVPFSVTLLFNPGTASTGYIILEKDNPSGDPARDDSFKIAIRFK